MHQLNNAKFSFDSSPKGEYGWYSTIQSCRNLLEIHGMEMIEKKHEKAHIFLVKVQCEN